MAMRWMRHAAVWCGMALGLAGCVVYEPASPRYGAYPAPPPYYDVPSYGYAPAPAYVEPSIGLGFTWWGGGHGGRGDWHDRGDWREHGGGHRGR